MALFAVAGMKIFIGDTPMNDQAEDFVAADFDEVVWTEIDGWSQCGALGDASQEIVTSLINRGRDVVQKGTKRSPAMENIFAVIPDDEGQIDLLAAEQTRDNFPFKIEWPDAPEGGTPTTRLFIALVMSAQEQGGEANTINNLAATLAVNGNIVHVAAAEGAG